MLHYARMFIFIFGCDFVFDFLYPAMTVKILLGSFQVPANIIFFFSIFFFFCLNHGKSLQFEFMFVFTTQVKLFF